MPRTIRARILPAGVAGARGVAESMEITITCVRCGWSRPVHTVTAQAAEGRDFYAIRDRYRQIVAGRVAEAAHRTGAPELPIPAEQYCTGATVPHRLLLRGTSGISGRVQYEAYVNAGDWSGDAARLPELAPADAAELVAQIAAGRLSPLSARTDGEIFYGEGDRAGAEPLVSLGRLPGADGIHVLRRPDGSLTWSGGFWLRRADEASAATLEGAGPGQPATP